MKWEIISWRDDLKKLNKIKIKKWEIVSTRDDLKKKIKWEIVS